MTSSNGTLKVKKTLSENYEKIRRLNASDISSLNGEYTNSASYATPTRTSAASGMDQRCETASLYCESNSTGEGNLSNTLIGNVKSDLPIICGDASKNYLTLNKDEASTHHMNCISGQTKDYLFFLHYTLFCFVLSVSLIGFTCLNNDTVTNEDRCVFGPTTNMTNNTPKLTLGPANFNPSPKTSSGIIDGINDNMGHPPISQTIDKSFSIDIEDTHVKESTSQDIDIGNLDDALTKNIDPNIVFNALKSLRLKNPNKIIIAHLNINSISEKFDQLLFIIRHNIDILVVGETKLDATFPSIQFQIDGYSQPYRRDRDRNGGGVIIFVRDDLPSKQLLKHTFHDDIEVLIIEINLRKTKFLLMGGYRPPSQSPNYFFHAINNALDVYTGAYDKLLLAGDFNVTETETVLNDFLYENDLKCLVKDKTCFKNPENPRCIDHFLTNFPGSFQTTTAICTGLSDFHKMIVTVQKYTLVKAKPKVIQYRCYKTFDTSSFRDELKGKLSITREYDDFEKAYLEVLNKHAPIKRKTVRANHAPYMTKALRKAIMTRSNLENKYLKNRNPENKTVYKKQKNYCSRLYKKERKRYYSNLNLKTITDNKRFWKTMKPFLTNKGVNNEKITLIENERILSADGDVAEFLNSFFSDATKTLGINENRYILNDTLHMVDSIEIALKKFESHPSILKINEKVGESVFSFNTVTLEDVILEIRNLNPNKASIVTSIPLRNLKENADICGPALHPIVNNAIHDCIFPDKLKLADIAPLHKKDDKTDKKNYRPISILPAVSKIFERIMQTQITSFINDNLYAYMSGYRKGYNTQYALMVLLEKWKHSLDNHGYAGAVIMDLSKAFDTINFELLIAKLHAYGFTKSALNMVHSYLHNRWHRTRINTTFSTWKELLTGVPQGSILGPLLFNIYINDLFFILEETDVCNYADDTGLYMCDMDLGSIIRSLEHDTYLAIEWFENNYMKLNKDKCHLVSGHKFEHLWINVGDTKIWESDSLTMLGVRFDRNLKFDNHVNEICKKAGRQLSALTRLANILPFQKVRILMKSFFDSQFSYCPLIWMFISRSTNHKINRLQERSLRILYKDDISSFSELLQKDHSVTVHTRNIHFLATEMYKVKNNRSPNFIRELLSKWESSYSLRHSNKFATPRVNSVFWGEETIRYIGPKIWDLLPLDIKLSSTLKSFILKVKKWKPDKCPCRVCKVYVPSLGFL